MWKKKQDKLIQYQFCTITNQQQCAIKTKQHFKRDNNYR